MRYFTLVFLLAAALRFYAIETSGLNGNIYSIIRLEYDEGMNYSRIETGANISINGEIFRKSLYNIDLKLRIMKDMVQTYEDLSTNMLHPELIVNELYFKQRSFPVKGIDVKAGRQILRWGSGSVLSVTDNVNPDNYDDPWLYGEKYGNEMIVIDAYRGELQAEIFAAPFFRPSLVNPGRDNFELEGVRTAIDSSKLLMPNTVSENISAGMHIGYTKRGYRAALSYIYSRDTYPWPEKIVLEPSPSILYVNSMSYLHFPRMHTAGAEFSGVAGDLGYWAEYAVFYIDSTQYELDMSALGRGVDTLMSIEGHVYSKALAGMDYRMNDIIYFNVQYMKGFYSERGNRDCAHYLFTGMLVTFPNSGFTFEPLNLGIEMRSFTDEDDMAIVYSPVISYTKDMLTVRLGGVTGKCGDNTLFGFGFKNEIEIGMKYVF